MKKRGLKNKTKKENRKREKEERKKGNGKRKRKKGKIYSAFLFHNPGYHLVIILISPVILGQLLLAKIAKISAILQKLYHRTDRME